MKKLLGMLAILALLCPALALADGPVLLVELPENAEMIEDIQFDDGDFIQTYALADGATVQLLRYASFDMTLSELIESDWPLCGGVEGAGIEQISGYPAESAHIWQPVDESGYPVEGEGSAMMECMLVVVRAGDCTLIYQGSYLSGERGDEVLRMVESLQVQTDEAEVG